ncbi:hypothetical protein ABH926_005158 [Catenulispora sp. GP43]|uniref:hypothetical protein n=1 Tax=Catenulispora sp. GP43 TaxID=3156263 RepID=UPI003517FFD6
MMNRQVNGSQQGQDELRAIREQAVGAALGKVLSAMSAARRPAASTASTDPPLTGSQVLAALMLLRESRARGRHFEPEIVDAARHLGTSWAELVPVFGVASRQADEHRYLRPRL